MNHGSWNIFFASAINQNTDLNFAKNMRFSMYNRPSIYTNWSATHSLIWFLISKIYLHKINVKLTPYETIFMTHEKKDFFLKFVSLPGFISPFGRIASLSICFGLPPLNIFFSEMDICLQNSCLRVIFSTIF